MGLQRAVNKSRSKTELTFNLKPHAKSKDSKRFEVRPSALLSLNKYVAGKVYTQVHTPFKSSHQKWSFRKPIN